MGREERVANTFYRKYLEFLALYRFTQTQKFIASADKCDDRELERLCTLDNLAALKVWVEQKMSDDYESMPVKMLRSKAASLSVREYWKLDKQELIEAIKHEVRRIETEALSSSQSSTQDS